MLVRIKYLSLVCPCAKIEIKLCSCCAIICVILEDYAGALINATSLRIEMIKLILSWQLQK